MRGKIMTDFVALSPKICSFLTDDNEGNKKTKRQGKGVIKNIKLEEKIINIVQKQNILKIKKTTQKKTVLKQIVLR